MRPTLFLTVIEYYNQTHDECKENHFDKKILNSNKFKRDRTVQKLVVAKNPFLNSFLTNSVDKSKFLRWYIDYIIFYKKLKLKDFAPSKRLEKIYLRKKPLMSLLILV